MQQMLLKGQGYPVFMHIKEYGKRYLMKSACIIILLSAFILSGCKGKEVSQPVIGPQTTEIPDQQGKGVKPPQTAPSQEPVQSMPETPANTPPRITSLNVNPQLPVAGDKVKAEVVASDKEGDIVTITYQWSKNDGTLSETSDTLLLSGDFKRGDKISLGVIPDDGKSKGMPLSVVMFVTNSSPVIKPSPETFRFDGNVYSYQVKATDPDSDPLSYSLKSAPAGMTIDTSGLIKWNVPPEFTGKTPITVSVTDGHGGESLQSPPSR